MKFVTKSWIQTQFSNFASRISTVFARKTEIPTKTSQLTNDSGFKTKDTTYSTMTGATASAAGKTGLVPAPAKGNQGKFLRGDGTWQNVTATVPLTTSLAVTEEGVVGLDGTVGKVLNDKIDALNNSFSQSIAPVLLWENTGSLSSFAAQTIQLSTGDFDYFEVIHTGYSPDYRHFNKGIKGKMTTLFSAVGVTTAYLTSRTLRFVDDTHISVNDAKSPANGTINLGTTDNARCVPVKIFGYKY